MMLVCGPLRNQQNSRESGDQLFASEPRALLISARHKRSRMRRSRVWYIHTECGSLDSAANPNP